MKKLIIITVLILITLHLGGCIKDNTGSLVLQITTMGIEPQTLLPDLDMNIATYVIIGQDLNGNTFEESDLTSTNFQKGGLTFGTWQITIYAKNTAGTVIGEGQETVIIHTNETTTVEIIVRPLEGTGTLTVNVDWNASDTENPLIDSRLIPHIGSDIPLEFTINADKDHATCIDNTIWSGYYSLVVKLMDNGALTMGAVEVVRILKDQTTIGNFEFYNLNQPGGTLIIGITPEMNDPIPVTITGQVTEITETDTMIVTASVPEEIGNVVYAWYINGDSMGEGSTYQIAGLPEGSYRLDVTAFTTDGKRAGSTTHSFIVTPAVELQSSIKTYKGLAVDIQDLAEDLFGNIMLGGHDNDKYLLSRLDQDGMVLWSKCYQTSGKARCMSLDISDDGAIYSCGTDNVYENNSYNYEGLIMKHTSEGEVIWAKTFGEEENDYLQCIKATNDGGFIVVGDTVVFNVSGKARIIKGDQSGTIEWQKVYEDQYDSAYSSVELMDDGSYLVVGYIKKNSYVPMLVKYNSDGTIAERSWFDYSGGFKYIGKTSDGGFVITGYGLGTSNTTDSIIVRLDSEGNILWSKTYGSENGEYGQEVMEANDGGFILTGSLNISGVFADGLIIKTDYEGNVEWSKKFDLQHADFVLAIVETADNYYLGGGQSYMPDTLESRGTTIKFNNFWAVPTNPYITDYPLQNNDLNLTPEEFLPLQTINVVEELIDITPTAQIIYNELTVDNLI